MASGFDLILTAQKEDCPICCDEKILVIIRRCRHKLCKQCLANSISTTFEYPVKCPCCRKVLDDQDIRASLDENELQIYEKKQISHATNSLERRHYCHAADCWFVCDLKDDEVTTWICQKCHTENCVACRDTHERESCQQYRRRTQKIRGEIEERVNRGEIMFCGRCRTIIAHARGCQWLLCDNCKAENCWKHKTLFQENGCDCSSNLRETREQRQAGDAIQSMVNDHLLMLLLGHRLEQILMFESLEQMERQRQTGGVNATGTGPNTRSASQNRPTRPSATNVTASPIRQSTARVNEAPANRSNNNSSSSGCALM